MKKLKPYLLHIFNMNVQSLCIQSVLFSEKQWKQTFFADNIKWLLTTDEAKIQNAPDKFLNKEMINMKRAEEMEEMQMTSIIRPVLMSEPSIQVGHEN